LYVLAVAIIVPTVAAQPELTFRNIIVNWPMIDLHFMTDCDGNPVYVQKHQVSVFENGREITDFSLFCYDPSPPCPISVALVCDVSASMGQGNPTPISGMKAAGHAFVDLMNGYSDEAAMIMFGSTVITYQSMTTIKPMLTAAVDALFASGGTALWDGAYAGVLEAITDGSNPCRAAIVMTDGADNASTRTPSEVIALARQGRVKIYTINLGSSIHSPAIELLATATGGTFYHTADPMELVDIYTDIMASIRRIPDECTLWYTADCADGSMRTVELRVDFCGDGDVKSLQYQAALDSSTFSDLHMQLGKVAAEWHEEIRVPLNLIDSLNDEMFSSFSFILEFDEECMLFEGVSAPTGTLLEGIPIDVTPLSNGVRIHVTDGRRITSPGVLMYFSFSPAEPFDTTSCMLRVVDPSFASGCFLPHVRDGEVRINHPFDPVLECTLDIPVVVANEEDFRYEPMPIPVTVSVTNTFGNVARSIRASIVLPNGLELAPPDAPDQFTKGLDLPELHPQQTGVATWNVQHALTDVETHYDISVRVWYAIPDTIECDELLVIPAMNLDPVPITLSSDGPLTFCEGESVVLDADEGYVSYEWNTGELTRMLTVTQSGSYYCEVKFANGRTGISDTVTVIVLPSPPKPLITRTYNVLTTLASPPLQWYRDGQLLPDETNQFLILKETGAYQVAAINEYGCTSISDMFEVTILNVEDGSIPESPHLTAYPDPASDELHIGIDGMRGESVRILLSDMLGRTQVVYEGRMDDINARYTISMIGKAQGPVFILAFFNDVVLVRKVMKQ